MVERLNCPIRVVRSSPAAAAAAAAVGMMTASLHMLAIRRFSSFLALGRILCLVFGSGFGCDPD